MSLINSLLTLQRLIIQNVVTDVVVSLECYHAVASIYGGCHRKTFASTLFLIFLTK